MGYPGGQMQNRGMAQMNPNQQMAQMNGMRNQYQHPNQHNGPQVPLLYI